MSEPTDLDTGGENAALPAAGVGLSPAPDGLQVLAVRGLPEFRPDDDLPATIAAAAPWIVDGDVLVVTSKVLSKTEGRLVRSPTDPEQRDVFRRRLIDSETVRLVAQVGRTKIVENHLGLIAAAAGVDASNVHSDEIALLPVDPDASAAALVRAFADRGLRVGVVVTDTQGRAWRDGVTDVAIGAAGIQVLDDHRGGVDEHGNELVVTQVATGDEMAAAADLVKGKLSAVPVAVLRGLDAPGVDTFPGGGRRLIRPYEQDLFRLGTDLAIEQGRREATGAGHRPVLQAEAHTLLTTWKPPNREQASHRAAFLGFLEARSDATERSCVPGHLTASAIVLSADRSRTLLTLHPRVGRWLQLGGHCEDQDSSMAGAALREAVEESGIDDLQILPELLQLEVHPIICSLGVPTRHFDVRFVVVAPPGAEPVISDESDDLAWWPIDQLPTPTDAGLADVVAGAVQLRRLHSQP